MGFKSQGRGLPHRPPANIPRSRHCAPDPAQGISSSPLCLIPGTQAFYYPYFLSEATDLDSSDLALNPGTGSETTSPPHPSGLPSPSQSPGRVSRSPGLKVLLSSLGTAGSCLRNPKKPPVPQVTDRACLPLSPHNCTPACSPRGHRTQHQGSRLHPNIVCVCGVGGVSCLSNSTMLQAGPPPPPDSAMAPRIPASGAPALWLSWVLPSWLSWDSQGRYGVGRLGNCFPRSTWQLAQGHPLCVHSHPVAAAGCTWGSHCPPGKWMGSKAHRVSSIYPAVPCPGPLGPSQYYAGVGGTLTPSPISSIRRT